MPLAKIFVIVLGFFVAWSVAKPPMQAADEFSHTARVESIPDNLWFSSGETLTAPSDRVNPYINSSRLRELPFHPERHLSNLEINALKGYEWGNSAAPVTIISQSHSYATAYFAPEYFLGRLLTTTFKLAPFESNWAYRFVSCLFCSALFTLFIVLLKSTFPKYWAPMAVLSMVNPQIGFTLSAIHPDAVFTPASLITGLLAYRACIGIGSIVQLPILALSALLAVFSKPLGIPMILALISAALLFAILFKEHRKNSLLAAASLIIALVIAQLAFFLWVKLEIYGVPLHLDIWGYLAALPEKPRLWFRQFFGSVGWLDTNLGTTWHLAMLCCLGINLLLGALHSLRAKDSKAWLYFGVFATTFIAGLLVGEFKYLDRAGYSIQGRYLFPVLPLLALAMVHNFNLVKRLSVAFILIYTAAYYNLSVHRYFASGWHGWLHNLPFWRSNNISVTLPVQTSTELNGTTPPGVLTEGPMLTYNITSSTTPAIKLKSEPAPYLTEMLELPQQNTWRISLLYRSAEEANNAAKSIITE
jgi:hypothetical protein